MATKNKITIAIASDHAGYKLKQELITQFSQKYQITDLGTDSEESVDYPDFAYKAVDYLKEHKDSLGVIICGSGVGVNIAANRHSHIRAVLCHDAEEVGMARKHNDVNVLTIGARRTSLEQAIEIVEKFVTTAFEGGRHEKRVSKLTNGDKYDSKTK